jgi:hypothetical protein
VVVAPDDVDGMAAALRDLHARWRVGTLDGPPLSEEWRRKVSRRTRSVELVRVLERITA